MTAKQAASKIIKMGGVPTAFALERYGATEQEAAEYMRWYQSARAKKFKKFAARKNQNRRPVLMFGHGRG